MKCSDIALEKKWRVFHHSLLYSYCLLCTCRLIAEKCGHILPALSIPRQISPICFIFISKSSSIHYLTSGSLISHSLSIPFSIHLLFSAQILKLNWILPSKRDLFIYSHPAPFLSHPPFSVIRLSTFSLSIICECCITNCGAQY